jgi:hypothetical protein
MRRSLALAFAALTLGACAVGPGYERPPTPVPTAYRGDTLQLVRDTAAAIAPLVPPVATPADTVAPTWDQTLGDTVLLALMDTARVHNQDLQATIAVTREFQARYAIDRSGFYPQINLFGAGGTGKSKEIGVPSVTSDFYDATAEASWELDLWGRVRRTSQAGKAAYFARTEDLRGAELSLAAAAPRVLGPLSSTRCWWRSARCAAGHATFPPAYQEGQVADVLQLTPKPRRPRPGGGAARLRLRGETRRALGRARRGASCAGRCRPVSNFDAAGLPRSPVLPS